MNAVKVNSKMELFSNKKTKNFILDHMIELLLLLLMQNAAEIPFIE